MNTERTPLFLMANLGAEVSRMLHAKESGNDDITMSAYVRAENILKQIRAFPEMVPREMEISALETVIRSIIEPNTGTTVSPYQIKNYFAPFALRLIV